MNHYENIRIPNLEKITPLAIKYLVLVIMAKTKAIFTWNAPTKESVCEKPAFVIATKVTREEPANGNNVLGSRGVQWAWCLFKC